MDMLYQGGLNRASRPPLSICRQSAKLVGMMLICASSATLAPSSAVGQSIGNLKGVVSTPEKKPLSRARISVAGSDLVAVSDTDGSFRITSLPAGAQTVEIKLLGYSNAALPVQIESGKEAVLLVTLTSVPVELKTVKVTADTIILPEMRGFMERKGRGSGTFLTREEIDRMAARTFTDILRRVPGMQLEARNGPFGATYTVESARMQGVNGGRGCQVLYFVNGVSFAMMGNLEINSFVRPDEVAAVEVYNGASQIPAQFNSTANGSRCGVVVIWTRIRSSDRKSN